MLTGYYMPFGYKGYVGNGKWMLFVSEEEYIEYVKENDIYETL